MSNNSSNQSGWLTPLGDDPVYDTALDQLLTRWLQNVTGYLAGSVWPRGSQEVPSLSLETDGCAFDLVIASADDNPALTQHQNDRAQLWRHEVIDCQVSFYGPSGMRYAARLRDGVCIAQNNTELNAYGLSLMNTSSIQPVPERINNVQVRRHDMRVCLHRKVSREYGIKSLVETPVQFYGD